MVTSFSQGLVGPPISLVNFFYNSMSLPLKSTEWKKQIFYGYIAFLIFKLAVKLTSHLKLETKPPVSPQRQQQSKSENTLRSQEPKM